MDLEKFFGKVNHDIIINRLSKRIEDKRVLDLIRKYLKSGIIINGVIVSNEEGTPQGGPLSPLLSNIMCDEVDKELERRGHKFCRFADDCNIYVKSKKAELRVLNSIKKLIEGKLKSKVKDITNRNKGISMELRLLKLNQITMGWINYFGIARAKRNIQNIEGWIRQRLRACI